MKNLLHFVITGGTIDSYFDPIEDKIVPLSKSVIPVYIKRLKLYEKSSFTEVCMKDSRDLTQKDRHNVLRAIEATKANRIIVTHGTYTLPDTARYVKSKIKSANKIIIFVASMVPLDGINMGDAAFNLGYSVAMSQTLNPGIYVCMNGRIFDPENVQKVLTEGRFSTLFRK